MYKEQALKMAKAKLECMERQTSGKAELCSNFCENCSLCYEQGNIGEQKEWLKMAIKALEQQLCEDWCEVPSYEMSLEQARQAVRDLRKFVMDNHILPKLQPCEDAISRQAVLEQTYSWCKDEFLRTTNSFDYLRKRIKSLPPVTPTSSKMEQVEQEPFINKSCISSEVCKHDKNKVLDKIRAEIKQNSYPIVHGVNNHERGMTLYGILQVIDKYRAESEVEE